LPQVAVNAEVVLDVVGSPISDIFESVGTHREILTQQTNGDAFVNTYVGKHTAECQKLAV
jgi:hypothetical protein